MQLLRALRSFPSSSRYLYLAWALFWIGGEGTLGVLFNIFLLRLGLEFIGSTGAVRMFTFAFSSLLAGYLGRTIGLRRTMMHGLLFVFLAVVAIPALGFLQPAPQRVLVYAIILARGFGAALFLASTYPYLAGAIPSESISHAFSLHWMLQPLSIFAGSLIAGMLPQMFSDLTGRPLDGFVPYQLALISSPVAMLLAWIAVRRVGEQRASSESETKDESRRASIVLVLICAPTIAMLSWAGRNGVDFFLNVYLDDELRIATTKMGSLRAIGQIVGATSAALVPPVVARMGKYRAIPVASALAAICLLFLGSTTNYYGIAVAYSGMMAFHTIGAAASAAFGQMMVPVDKRPILSGLSNMAVGVSSSAISLTGGFLAGSVGLALFFRFSSVLIAAHSVLFLIFYFNPKGEYRKLDRWHYRYRL